MARTEARLKCSVWDDQDYRSLTLEAQWLYEAILSQKDLSLCGVLTWTPKRFAKLASNANAAATRKALELLREKRYVVLDESTDELWVRTLIKNDGVLTNNNSIIGMSRSFEAIHSNPIREGIVQAVADQVAQGGTEGGTPTGLVEGLPEGIRKRVGKVFANALALACTGAPPRPPVPPASGHPPPASGHPPPASPTSEHRSSSNLSSVGDEPVEEEDLDVVDQALLAIATAKLDRCLNDPDHKPINDRAGWLAAVVAKDRMAFGAQMSTMAAAGATVDLLVRTFDRQPPAPAGPEREQLPPAFEIDEATGMAVPVSA